MARRVFYSFHYKADNARAARVPRIAIEWRAWFLRARGVTERGAGGSAEHF
jgi:hypothetical protein